MNLTTNTLACAGVGDGWSALETSPNGATWSALAPSTARAGQTHVKMWLKGVTIDGVIRAADPDSAAYPELSGPVYGYRGGLIQIIKKPPVMVARYEGYKYRRWLQRTIPFFDSTGVGASPWYNAGARTDLVAGMNAAVQLQDYPTTIASVLYDPAQPNSGRIEELQKTLEFDVYLAVSPRSAHYKQFGIRILWQMEWSTETHLRFTSAAGGLSYTVSKFTRHSTAPTAVTAAQSKAQVLFFPGSAEGANEAISSSTLI